MAGDTKDVELRIRARDYSQQTLEKLTETLAQLVKAQDAQLQAAKKGESSARSLEKSYQALENAGKALIGQAGLVKTFQNQSDALTEVKTRLEAARTAQQAYLNSVAGVEKITKDQRDEMKRLAQEVASTERAQAKLEERMAKTTQRLSDAGISTDNLAAAQQQIVNSVGQVNAALERQDRAMLNLDGDMRALADAERRRNAEAAQRAALDARNAAETKRLADEARAAADQREKQLAVDRTFSEAVRKAEEAAAEATRKEAAARQAQRDALSEAADQAARLQREYAKMAKGGTPAAVPNVSGAIKDIADPLTAQMRTIEGIGNALTAIESKIANASGPIKQFTQSTKELEAAQKSLQAVAGQIDAYAKQMVAVRAARAEVQQQRQALAELSAQARSGTGGPELVTQMNTVQAALKRASITMGEEVTAARVMRDALRAAGIDTRDLAAANDTLIATANRTKSAVDGLGTVYQKYGAEIEKAGQAQKMKWFDGGRTTLSWIQRIRGEILGITTAYIGLQAGINLAASAVDAYRKDQTIQTRLSQVVGNDTKKVADEMDYLRGVADKLGLEFETSALSYSKFAIAAKSTGTDLQTTRFIFEGLAQASTAARLSSEEFERVLKAVEQMLSKGTISAEELKGQLGDALPGAIATMAKSMNIEIGTLLKQMEQGQVSAEYIVDFARQLKKDSADAVGNAEKSFEATNNRLKNSIYDFQKAIAKSGFIDAYSDFLKKLTEVLSSDQGRQLAQTLSDGFTAVVQILQWCAENMDTLKMATAAFIGLNIFGFLGRVVANFAIFRAEVVGVYQAVGGLLGLMRGVLPAFGAAAGAAGTIAGAATGAAGAVGLLTTALKIMGRSIPLIGAALTAYEVYKLLAGDKKTADAKKAGADVKKAYLDGFNGTEDPGGTGADGGFKALMKEVEKQQKSADKKLEASNLKGAKADLAERKRLVEEHYAGLKAMADKAGKDDEQRAQAQAAVQKLINTALTAEEKKFYNEQAQRGESAAQKRIKMAEEVAQALERINDDLAKREAEADPNAPFETRRAAALQAISHEYDKLINKVNELARVGNAEQKALAKTAKERIADYVAERQKVEGMKQDRDELQLRERRINEQLQLRTSIQDMLKAQRDAGLITEAEFQAKMIENNNTMAEGVAKAAESFRQLVEAKKALMRPEEYTAAMAQINAVLARNSAANQNSAQQLAFAQQTQTRLMDEYQRKQAQIRAEEEAGILTVRQATDQQAALNNEYRNKIIAQAEEVKGLAMAAMTPENREAMLALIGQMDVLIAKTNDARTGFTWLDQTIVQAGTNAVNGAFDAMVNSLNEMVTSQKSVAQGFVDMGRQAALFFAQFMRDIALAIIRQQLFNALKNSGNPILAAIGAAGGASNTVGSRHNGGVVNGAGNSRRVDPSVFAGAPRFHEGGLPGLQHNEVATILQKGEEVLTREDPRNVLNGGASGGGASPKFVLVDDRSRVAEAMQSADGERAILVNIQKNLPTLRSWLK